jgi:hypothetical protein
VTELLHLGPEELRQVDGYVLVWGPENHNPQIPIVVHVGHLRVLAADEQWPINWCVTAQPTA